MSLYNTISKRRSVRNFDHSELDVKTLDAINDFILNVKQLRNCNARFEIVEGSRVKDKIAPYYILAFSKAEKNEYINIGYVLEEVDLYLQSNNLGSLWLGLGRTSEKLNEYVIMMAFGKTKVPYRKNISEFKRLNIKEISSEDNSIAQVARLSPSATNSQPWKMEFLKNKIRIKYFGRGVLQRILRAKFSMVDLGIITKITEIALLQEGRIIKLIQPNIKDKDIYVDIDYK